MGEGIMEYYPGTRVNVFDPRLFKDDITTPISMTVRSAIVVRWYGKLKKEYWTYYDDHEGWQERILDFTLGPYFNLVDVIFDYDGHESHGHFADWMEVIT
jgi:hypothetical protein